MHYKLCANDVTLTLSLTFIIKLIPVTSMERETYYILEENCGGHEIQVATKKDRLNHVLKEKKKDFNLLNFSVFLAKTCLLY
jgi:hypothetical protein